jgi:hypothetical protein
MSATPKPVASVVLVTWDNDAKWALERVECVGKNQCRVSGSASR